MNRLFACLLLVSCVVCLAQAPHIRSGATVYIEPMKGYEAYLAAAIDKEKVPLVIVTDEDKAEYILRSTIIRDRPEDAIPGPTSATISLVDIKSSQVILAYSTATHRDGGLQKTAAACAQRLKEFIEKPRK